MEVEDPLREALVGVGRGVEEDERDREPEERRAVRAARTGSFTAASSRRHRTSQASATTYSNARPGEQREDRVVEREEPEVARPTPPTTIGIAIGRKRSGSSSSRARPATAIAPKSVPTVQMPTSASATAATVRPSTPEKNARERGQRDDLGAGEEREAPRSPCRARSRCGRTARARARRTSPARARRRTRASGRAAR